MGYPGNPVVTGPISLSASVDTYPTHWAELGKGGHASVATLADLSLIPTVRREFGMIRAVHSDSTPANNGFYVLANLNLGGVDNTLTNNANWIELALGGSATTVSKVQTFTADGILSTFTVTNGTVDQISFVAVNGVIQTLTTHYTVSGQDISFTTAPDSGFSITVSYFESVALGSIITDGDKGDIIVSASGSTWTIDNGVVTIAKISATGTPNSTTFLRGDGTWATVSGEATTASNGLTLNTLDVRLGGTLTQNTSISGDNSTYSLTLGSTGGGELLAFEVNAGTTNVATNEFIIMGGNDLPVLVLRLSSIHGFSTPVLEIRDDSSSTIFGLTLNRTGTLPGSNMGFGFEALSTVTSPTSYGNVAIGYQAMADATTGTENVMIGFRAAGLTAMTGNQNVGIGPDVMSSPSAITGDHNVMIGWRNGENLTSGNNNLGLGATVLVDATTANNNVALGTSALSTLVTGTHNTAIGVRAATGLTSGGDNIIIGNWVNPPSLTGSRQLNIGNVLYGTSMHNSHAASSTPIAAGNIGIGLTTPTARLHLAAGTATASSAPIKLTTGVALTTPEDGAFEYHSSHLYFTIGSTRYQLDQQTSVTPTLQQVLTAGSVLTTNHAIDTSTFSYFTGVSDAGLHINTSYVTFGNEYKYGLWSPSPLTGDGVAVGFGDLDGTGDGSYAGVFMGAADREVSMAAGSTDSQTVELFFQAFTGSGFVCVFDDNRTTPVGIEYGAAGYVVNARSLTDKEYVDDLVAANTFDADPDTLYWETEDFIWGTSNIGTSSMQWIEVASGTGAQVDTSAFGADTTENAMGVQQISTGTTTTGRCAFGRGSASTLFSNGAVYRLLMRNALEALSDGTDTYTAYFGFYDNPNAGDATDGAYFRYTDTVNGGRWEAVTSNNNTRTATDTGVSPAAGVFQRFEIIANAAGTSIEFYINGSLVATNTTNIPTGAGRQTGPALKIEKSVGTTARSLYIDWYKYVTTRTTAR